MHYSYKNSKHREWVTLTMVKAEKDVRKKTAKRVMIIYKFNQNICHKKEISLGQNKYHLQRHRHLNDMRIANSLGGEYDSEHGENSKQQG